MLEVQKYKGDFRTVLGDFFLRNGLQWVRFKGLTLEFRVIWVGPNLFPEPVYTVFFLLIEYSHMN